MEREPKTQVSANSLKTNWPLILALLVANTILARALAIFIPSFIAVGISCLVIILAAHRFRRQYSFRNSVLVSLCYAIIVTGVAYIVYRLSLG